MGFVNGVITLIMPTLSGLDVYKRQTQTGANDVYHIKGEDGKEVLIPAIADVVLETDVDGGVMRIRPLKGLFDDED